uniref:Uncharacterized protein n=1 Tax=Plectus sambesii TaxID=2011161 RepID=A0A914WPW1_9BILA
MARSNQYAAAIQSTCSAFLRLASHRRLLLHPPARAANYKAPSGVAASGGRGQNGACDRVTCLPANPNQLDASRQSGGTRAFRTAASVLATIDDGARELAATTTPARCLTSIARSRSPNAITPVGANLRTYVFQFDR